MPPETITPQTTVLDIVAAHKETEPVFRSYDQIAGECVLCNSLFETLEGLAIKYALDLKKLLAEIRQAITPAE